MASGVENPRMAAQREFRKSGRVCYRPGGRRVSFTKQCQPTRVCARVHECVSALHVCICVHVLWVHVCASVCT